MFNAIFSFIKYDVLRWTRPVPPVDTYDALTSMQTAYTSHIRAHMEAIEATSRAVREASGMYSVPFGVQNIMVASNSNVAQDTQAARLERITQYYNGYDWNRLGLAYPVPSKPYAQQVMDTNKKPNRKLPEWW